jgi:hypothetical protein
VNQARPIGAVDEKKLRGRLGAQVR